MVTLNHLVYTHRLQKCIYNKHQPFMRVNIEYTSPMDPMGYMYLDTPQGSPRFFIRNFRHLWPQRNSQLVIAARIPGKQRWHGPCWCFQPTVGGLVTCKLVQNFFHQQYEENWQQSSPSTNKPLSDGHVKGYTPQTGFHQVEMGFGKKTKNNESLNVWICLRISTTDKHPAKTNYSTVPECVNMLQN